MAGGASHKTMLVHVGFLTAVFSLMQLLFAPLWGRLSDRFGRRPLLLLGIAGYALAQLLFGLATSLLLLYSARILGGILASATTPAATAYVADATSEKERARGMAWLGTAVSMGAVAGLALGGLTTWQDWHIYSRGGHLLIRSFSLPFFIAAALTVVTLVMAFRWLPESTPLGTDRVAHKPVFADWKTVCQKIWPLLSLSIMSQFALTLFETVFVLHSQAELGYGAAQIGIAFMVCGVVMATYQDMSLREHNLPLGSV